MGDELRGESLCVWLRDRRGELLARWEQETRREVEAGRGLSRPELLDHLPALLDRVIEMIRVLESGGEPEVPQSDAEQHAQHRVRKGFELGDMVREYALLRRCILELVERDRGVSQRLAPVHTAIDRAVEISIEAFVESRNRTVMALERIAAVSFAASGLEPLLEQLLRVFVETTPAVDTSAIYLRSGARLEVRAGIGIEPGPGLTVDVGQGFAGQIAATRRPDELTDASSDRRVESEVLRRSGVRALYGVPLCASDDVIGVALMGSHEAWTFSAEDRGLFGVMADRASAAIQLHRLHEEARDRAEVLRGALDFRERLIGMLGHDLRTPLASIQMGAQLLLRREDLPPPYLRPLARVANSAARMNRMIGDIVDFARSTQDRSLPIERKLVGLGEIVEMVLDEVQLGHGDRVLRLERRGECEGLWDPDRIAQLVTNLLENALRYGDPDRPVTVRIAAEDGMGQIEVHNWGPPVLPEQAAHIFEPFATGGGEQGGLGLGLYIVCEIARAHGGRIEFDSSAESGTVFRAVLPRRPEPAS